MADNERYRSRPQQSFERYERRGERGDGREYGGGTGSRAVSIARPLSSLAIGAGLLVWTLLAGGGYLVADVVLNWIIASQGEVISAGKDAATLFGVGKEIGVVVDLLAGTGLVEQILGLIRLILLPGAIAIWLLGAIVIVAVPTLIGRIAGRFARPRY